MITKYNFWQLQYHLCLQVPKLLELVGLGYTSWFVYRYLLFKVTLKRLLAVSRTWIYLVSVLLGLAQILVLQNTIHAINVWQMFTFMLTLQSSRQELIQDVDELKKKITGAAEE